MKRITLALLLVLLTAGCATTRPEMVDGQSLSQQLEAYIDDYLDQVLDQCIEIHGKAQAGETPVDCAFDPNYRRLHLSFPNQRFLTAHLQDINRLASHWCAASQSKTGKSSEVISTLRREHRSWNTQCRRTRGSATGSP